MSGVVVKRTTPLGLGMTFSSETQRWVDCRDEQTAVHVVRNALPHCFRSAPPLARVLFGVGLPLCRTVHFAEAQSSGHYPNMMTTRSTCCVFLLLFGCSDEIGSPESLTFSEGRGVGSEGAEAESMAATPGSEPEAEPADSPSDDLPQETAPPDATDDANATNEADAPDDANAASSTSTGAELFAAMCAPCHGEAGAGSALGPEVQHPVGDFAEWVVRNGYSGAFDAPMPNYAPEVLSDDDLSSIIDYLRGLPAPATEEGLYLDYCSNCHGSDARGGPSGKEIAGKNELAEVVRQGKGGSDFGARRRYMPSWGAGELDASTVGALERFVGNLPE